MLFDPSEEQFDLPAAAIQFSDGERGKGDLVGEKNQGSVLLCIMVFGPDERTDGDGRFLIRDVGIQVPFAVDVLAPDYPPASSKQMKLAAGTTKLDDIVLGERGARVVVRVLDKADLAVSGVKVMLLADPAGLGANTRGSWLHHQAFRQQGVTSRLGSVRFSGVAPGRIIARIKTADGTAEQRAVGFFRPRTSSNIEETMVKTNTNFWRLFSRNTAAGLVLLLVLAGWPPTAAAKIRSDWSRVQRVTPGTRTTVLLYKDQAPQGKRKVEGRFHSATAEAIALLLPDGQRHTLQKQLVLKVLVYRPLVERYQGWTTAGILAAIVAGAVAKAETPSEPLHPGVAAAGISLFVGVPTIIAFLVAPKMGGIYNVPPDLRDPSSTGTKPPQDRSSATVPEVKDSEASPAGSEVEDKSSPDRLRQQARQALLRKGLPLHLPDLTVRGLSAERTGMQTTFDGSFPRAGEVSRRAGLD